MTKAEKVKWRKLLEEHEELKCSEHAMMCQWGDLADIVADLSVLIKYSRPQEEIQATIDELLTTYHHQTHEAAKEEDA